VVACHFRSRNGERELRSGVLPGAVVRLDCAFLLALRPRFAPPG
jgi:hypothetical protein